MAKTIDTIAKSRWLDVLVATTFTLNILDAILTIVWVLSKSATEGNPVMDHLLQKDPLLFLLTKVALVALGLLLLWRVCTGRAPTRLVRERRFALIGVFIGFLLYLLVFLIHAAEIATRVGELIARR